MARHLGTGRAGWWRRADAYVAGGVVTVGVIAAAAGLIGSRAPLRDADVLLRDPHLASVVRDGRVHPARDGELLRSGDEVRTAAGGRAELDVRSRRIRLRDVTAVVVPDGATVRLVSGSILVDRRRGPAVEVQAGDVRVDRIEPGALRVDRGYSVQVAVYSGGARVATSSGRSLQVPALFQAALAGRAAPIVPAPLVLQPGDTWERDVVPEVVALDAALLRLARGIDTGWSRSRLASLPATVRAVPAGTAPSEVVVTQAIGEAAARRGTPGDPFAEAARLRGAGGSWGVVASLLGTEATEVSDAVADLLAGVPPTPVPVPAPPAPVAVGAPRGTPQPAPTTTRSGSPTAGPTPSSSPSPSASASPPDPIASLVGEVQKQLPTPLPTLDTDRGVVRGLLGLLLR